MEKRKTSSQPHSHFALLTKRMGVILVYIVSSSSFVGALAMSLPQNAASCVRCLATGLRICVQSSYRPDSSRLRSRIMVCWCVSGAGCWWGAKECWVVRLVVHRSGCMRSRVSVGDIRHVTALGFIGGREDWKGTCLWNWMKVLRCSRSGQLSNGLDSLGLLGRHRFLNRLSGCRSGSAMDAAVRMDLIHRGCQTPGAVEVSAWALMRNQGLCSVERVISRQARNDLLAPGGRANSA